MSRASKKIIQQVSKEDFDEALKNYAYSEAMLRKVNAEIDLKTNAIREKYSSTIEANQEQLEQSFEVLQKYCEENNEVLFSKKKSIETAFGVLGFRTGTPKLKTLKGFTWSSVMMLMKGVLPEYIRVKEEPNKEALLMDREKLDLAKVGLEVSRDEVFFVEVKEEENVIS